MLERYTIGFTKHSLFIKRLLNEFSFFYRLKNAIKFFRFGWKFDDLSGSSLLEVERFQLTRLYDLYSLGVPFVDVSKLRNLRLAISLLDIILYEPDQSDIKVNIMNAARFLSFNDLGMFSFSVDSVQHTLKSELRRRKALNIYNKLREQIVGSNSPF